MTKPRDFLAPELTQRFISLPGERLIVAKRQHWFVLFPSLVLTGLLALFIISTSGFFFFGPATDPTLFVITAFLTLIAAISIVSKIIADWHYHMYIFTTKRILEVSCAPLFSHSINDVALDQVRVTEVQVRIRGLVDQFLNKGDVAIAFDRPSHDQMFVIPDISDPSETGALIANSVKLMMESSPVWFQPRQQSADLYKFTEDVAQDHVSSVIEA